MPMQKPKDFGTSQDGSQNLDYCCYCYQKGEFINKCELPEFTELQVKIATQKLGMPEAAARESAQNTLPNLKRWKQ
jgi:hypothetical protein